jgi:hypothetical protein
MAGYLNCCISHSKVIAFKVSTDIYVQKRVKIQMILEFCFVLLQEKQPTIFMDLQFIMLFKYNLIKG